MQLLHQELTDHDIKCQNVQPTENKIWLKEKMADRPTQNGYTCEFQASAYPDYTTH